MSQLSMKPGSRPFHRGDFLYAENSSADKLCILLQGKVAYRLSPSRKHSRHDMTSHSHSYRLFEVDRNVFLGASDVLEQRNCRCTCQATEDGNVFVYPLNEPEDLWSLIQSQKDYGTFVLQSLGLMLDKTHRALNELRDQMEQIRVCTENLALYFWTLKDKFGLDHTPSIRFLGDMFEQYTLMKASGFSFSTLFDKTFMETDHGESDTTGLPEKTNNPVPCTFEHILLMNEIPLDVRKVFLGADSRIAARHIQEAANTLNDMLILGSEMFAEAEMLCHRLYTDAGESLFSCWSSVIRELVQIGQPPSGALQAIDYLLETIRLTSHVCESRYDHPPEVDLAYLEHMRSQLDTIVVSSLENALDENGRVCAGRQALPEEIQDSVVKLLQYATIPSEDSDNILNELIAFRSLKDRFSQKPEDAEIRKGISPGFQALYGSVLRRTLQEGERSRLINMFLLFGYADEWLLTPEQTLVLYRLAGKPIGMGSDSCTGGKGVKSGESRVPLVHTLPDWMDRIHSHEIEPSRNEFDQDYGDVFREKKRQGWLTDGDKAAYDADVVAKLTFELNVLLGTNQKTCYGKPGIFYPILHRDMITRDLESSAVTPERVHAAVEKVLEVDYSAFYREVHFVDPKKVIEKERIMKPVAPDIILIPTFGSRGVMWQEISGRSRTSPGRFLLPAFTDESLDTMIPRLVGHFRWELCRTIMGSAWNDVTHRCLTSEYSDYLQFYKTNRDLSDDAKAKLRTQITKYHGNTREIFTADYETWIRNESMGNLRLNKVVRGIMSRYCPFARKIRDKMEKHPAHADAIRLFNAGHAKEAKALENRYARYRESSGTLHPDLAENLHFYRDL